MSVRLNGTTLDAALYGSENRLGVVIATTTSQNNNDTATPFNNTGNGLGGKLLLIQPDVACYVATGKTSSVTAATTSKRLEANERHIINMPSDHLFLACRAVATGTVNLQVHEKV